MVACIRFGSEAFFLRSFGSMKPLGWFWHGFGKGSRKVGVSFAQGSVACVVQKEETIRFYAWLSRETGGRYGNEDGCACESSREWRRA